VLTHFHLDHVVGLAYLPALGLAERPRLHAAGALAVRHAFARDPRAAARPATVRARRRRPVGRRRRAPGRAQRIGAFDVATRAQTRHDAPTAGLRIDGWLAW